MEQVFFIIALPSPAAGSGHSSKRKILWLMGQPSSHDGVSLEIPPIAFFTCVLKTKTLMEFFYCFFQGTMVSTIPFALGQVRIS